MYESGSGINVGKAATVSQTAVLSLARHQQAVQAHYIIVQIVAVRHDSQLPSRQEKPETGLDMV